MLVPLLLAFLTPLCRPGLPPALHDLVEFGALRHVQLLESRGEVVRFATQIELGTMQGSRPEEESSCIAVFEGASTEPVQELTLETSILPVFSWTVRPAWLLMELGEQTVLAVLEPYGSAARKSRAEHRLRLLAFPEGKEILSVGRVDGIEDALFTEGSYDLLARSGGDLVWIRSRRVSSILVTRLALGLDHLACAAFCEGTSRPWRSGWAVGWREGRTVAVPIDEGAAGLDRTVAIRFQGEPGQAPLRMYDPLRAAAWSSQERAYLAVSWPGYDDGKGKLQVLEMGAEPRKLWEGRPYPDVDASNSVDQREYGQCLAFVPDWNGDGVPELLLSGPWSWFDSSIDLLSGKDGSLLRRWLPEQSATTGHSLSAVADRVLVGGAAHPGYPEDLSQEGQAYLLELPSLRPLQSWKIGLRKQ